MTRTVEIAGTFVRVEIIAWGARSVLARRIDNGALMVVEYLAIKVNVH